MSKHTPTPWRQDPFVDAIHILAADGSKVAMLADRPLDSIGMPPDNARFIVRACNAHEELVAAAEAALSAIETKLTCVEDSTWDAVAVALRSSIALAKASP